MTLLIFKKALISHFRVAWAANRGNVAQQEKKIVSRISSLILTCSSQAQLRGRSSGLRPRRLIFSLQLTCYMALGEMLPL